MVRIPAIYEVLTNLFRKVGDKNGWALILVNFKIMNMKTTGICKVNTPKKIKQKPIKVNKNNKTKTSTESPTLFCHLR